MEMMDMTAIAAPEVATVKRVSPEAGDVFVLSCEQRLSPNMVSHIRRAWEEAVPGTRAVVLSDGLKIQKLQPRMTEAIDALNDLPSGDGEATHSEADRILLSVLEANGLSAIGEAWKAASERCRFYYA